MTIRNGDEVEDGLYMFVVNDYITLVKFDGENINVAYTYTAYKVPKCYYDAETGYIWGTIYKNQTGYNITRFVVSNEKVVLEDTFSENIGSYDNYLAVYAKENTFITFSLYSGGKIKFDCYTISDDAEISKTSFTKNVSDMTSISILNNCGSRFYALMSGAFTSGNNQTAIGFINVSNVESETEIKNIRSISANKTTGMNTSRVIEKNGKAFFLYRDSGTSDNNDYLCVYDMESENYTTHGVSGLVTIPSNITYRYFAISEFLTDDVFLAKINDYFFLLKYYWNTDSIERNSNIVNNTVGNGVILAKQNKVSVFGQYATIFTVDGNALLAGEDQKIIQSYDKDIGSIGLAKNSGSAGTSIAVYMPR